MVFGRGEWTTDAQQALERFGAVASRAPILVVAGGADVALRVAALAAGADDFLSVPFEADEFVARARVLVRRAARLRWGPLRIDPIARVALLDNQPLALTAREFDLMVRLVRRGGTTATRTDLAREVRRAADAAASNWLDVHMNSIRRKLGRHAQLVETVRGEGYRLRRPEE